MSRPTATYRLQFRNGMTLAQAARLTGYLVKLGASHLYASPLFAAAPGSTHGYDGTDFSVMEPAIGGEAGYEGLSAALQADGLGLMLDFVPNHMAASIGNPWWESVLEWGEVSPHAGKFDIDWRADRLLLPILGSGYAEALDGGLLGLAFHRNTGRLSMTIYEHALPLTPPSYRLMLEMVRAPEFASLAAAFGDCSAADSQALFAKLAQLGGGPHGAALNAALDAINADAEAMHALHEAQIWRLAHWRLAREALTYRRFFEITGLIGLRVENAPVFDSVHARLFSEIKAGRIDSVRLDHIDGLADPKAYLEQFQQAAAGAGQPFPLWVEKILEHDEGLPADWPVAGTTGYEFITALAGLFTDADREAAMSTAYQAFAGPSPPYDQAAAEAKRALFEHNLAAELAILTASAHAIGQSNIATRDIGTDSLRRAILELAVALPVYRTYVDASGPGDGDLALIEMAVQTVKESRLVEDMAAIDFIADLCRLEAAGSASRAAALAFTTRFQQTSGPVMAKGLEDTLFFRFNRLIGLNEVGGAPDVYGAPVADFHAAMAQRLATQPDGLSATSTHDTKRGEDARTRLYGLSEMPDRWAEAVKDWAAMNAPFRSALPTGPAPEPAAEWMFYQALAGAWPCEAEPGDGAAMATLRDRMLGFMEKAVREAKTRTSWTAQDPAYEAAVAAFVTGVLSPEQNRRFLKSFAGVCRPVWLAGAVTSLSQLAIKLTAPGVPDIYQGCELWNFSLVDPDNRAPVDFAARQSLLARIEVADASTSFADWRGGAPKMTLTRAGLLLRRAQPELFARGAYLPLVIEGEQADNAVAFARCFDGRCVLTIVPRLVAGLMDGQTLPIVPPAHWQDTRVVLPDSLRPAGLNDVITAKRRDDEKGLFLAEILADFPIALLRSS